MGCTLTATVPWTRELTTSIMSGRSRGAPSARCTRLPALLVPAAAPPPLPPQVSLHCCHTAATAAAAACTHRPPLHTLATCPSTPPPPPPPVACNRRSPIAPSLPVACVLCRTSMPSRTRSCDKRRASCTGTGEAMPSCAAPPRPPSPCSCPAQEVRAVRLYAERIRTGLGGLVCACRPGRQPGSSQALPPSPPPPPTHTPPPPPPQPQAQPLLGLAAQGAVQVWGHLRGGLHPLLLPLRGRLLPVCARVGRGGHAAHAVRGRAGPGAGARAVGGDEAPGADAEQLSGPARPSASSSSSSRRRPLMLLASSQYRPPLPSTAPLLPIVAVLAPCCTYCHGSEGCGVTQT